MLGVGVVDEGNHGKPRAFILDFFFFFGKIASGSGVSEELVL